MSEDVYGEPPRFHGDAEPMFTDGTYSEQPRVASGMYADHYELPQDHAGPVHEAEVVEPQGLGGSPIEDLFNKTFRRDKYEEDKERLEFREQQYAERVSVAQAELARQKAQTRAFWLKGLGAAILVGGVGYLAWKKWG